METKMIEASPRKLRSGAWGAAIQSPPPKDALHGVTVEVKTQKGKTWLALVSDVVFHCDEYAIVATESMDGGGRGGYRRETTNGGRRGGQYSCGYPCPVNGHICTDDHPCHDCE